MTLDGGMSIPRKRDDFKNDNSLTCLLLKIDWGSYPSHPDIRTNYYRRFIGTLVRK